MPNDTDELLDVAADVLPADWTPHNSPNVDLRMKGRRTEDGTAWTYTLVLDGATWMGTATVDGTEVAAAEVTFAASYEPTDPDNLRTVAEQLRGRLQKVEDAPNSDD